MLDDRSVDVACGLDIAANWPVAPIVDEEHSNGMKISRVIKSMWSNMRFDDSKNVTC